MISWNSKRWVGLGCSLVQQEVGGAGLPVLCMLLLAQALYNNFTIPYGNTLSPYGNTLSHPSSSSVPPTYGVTADL